MTQPIVLVGFVMAGLLVFWLLPRDLGLSKRIPGTDSAPNPANAGLSKNPVLLGSVLQGHGTPSGLPGNWPQFRGIDRNAIAVHDGEFKPNWNSENLKTKWVVDVGEGYAGPVVADGCVYLMDYDRENQSDTLRCLSLEDGKEIWRYAYPLSVKRNHGMSRTVPVIADDRVIALGPKCHLLCLNAHSGELIWTYDLVSDFSATVPPWYTGQCPLIVEDKVVVAVGSDQGMLMAFDLADGKPVWNSPNPESWKMTHSSVMEIVVEGETQLVYCASGGVVGVSLNGKKLWSAPEWKISIATVPSPVDLGGGRIFLCGGYNAGSMILKVTRSETESGWEVSVEQRIKPSIFGSTQQTPILYRDHLFGVREDGDLVCMDLSGIVLWTSDNGINYGLGPYLVVGDHLLLLNDKAELSVLPADPSAYNPVMSTLLLEEARESWGPMAWAGNRLLVRDLTRMMCLSLDN